MRASILKEFREYGRYAALAAVVLSAVLIYVLNDKNGSHLSVVGEPYLTVVRFAFAACGLTIGFVSMIVDRRRGHWGFAVHRPSPRWKLFAAKAIGTGLLYLVATSVAVGAASLCAMNPAYVRAPFAPGMLLMTLYAQACGLLCVLTGLLIAARPARWFGSRLFPAVLTLAAVSAGSEWVLTFGGAAICLAAGALLLAVAGAGFFARNGEYDSQSRWTKPASFLAVLPGATLALTAAVNLLPIAAQSQTVQRWIDGPPPAQPQYVDDQEANQSYEYASGPGGQPYLFARRSHRTVPWANAQGVRLSPADVDWMQHQASNLNFVSATDPASANFSSRLYRESFHRPGTHLRVLPPWHVDERAWYVGDTRVIAIQSTEGKPLGTIGRDGFHAPGEPAAAFPPGTTYSDLYGAADGSLVAMENGLETFVIDVKRREAFRIFQTDATDPVCGTGFLRGGDANGGDVPMRESTTLLAVVTRKRVVAVPLNGSAATSVPIEWPPASYATYRVMPLGGGDLAVQYELGGPFSVDRSTYEQGSVVVTSRGGRIESVKLPRPPNVPTVGLPEPAWRSYARWVPMLVAMPPGFSVCRILLNWQFWHYTPDNRGLWRVGWFWWSVMPTMLVPGVIGVVLTAWVLRGRGVSRRARWLWLVASALVGPALAVTLVCLWSQSLRLHCPACGRKRSTDREICPHCGAAWPAAGNAATDVFEDERAAA